VRYIYGLVIVLVLGLGLAILDGVLYALADPYR
jgi:hypothetical protein